jgi:hypothetical protein
MIVKQIHFFSSRQILSPQALASPWISGIFFKTIAEDAHDPDEVLQILFTRDVIKFRGFKSTSDEFCCAFVLDSEPVQFRRKIRPEHRHHPADKVSSQLIGECLNLSASELEHHGALSDGHAGSVIGGILSAGG